MFATSIYSENDIKQCTRRATMAPWLWRMMRVRGERGEIKSRSKREKGMREEPFFSVVPLSAVGNVSAVNQQCCEETAVCTVGLY